MMKLFKTGKNVRKRILIRHMAGVMVKKQGRSRFYFSYYYFCILYFMVKMQLVNLHTSAW